MGRVPLRVWLGLVAGPYRCRQRDELLLVRFGSWPCKNVFEAWFLGGCEEIDAFRAVYALIATISGRTPMMFITLVKL
jgi:hypothetical protein